MSRRASAPGSLALLGRQNLPAMRSVTRTSLSDLPGSIHRTLSVLTATLAMTESYRTVAACASYRDVTDLGTASIELRCLSHPCSGQEAPNGNFNETALSSKPSDFNTRAALAGRLWVDRRGAGDAHTPCGVTCHNSVGIALPATHSQPWQVRSADHSR